MNPSDPNTGLAARVERLEVVLTHVDALVTELNRVVAAQGKEIDILRAKCERISQRVVQVEETAKPQERSPEDERPPHY